jgi:hypothetical protein
MVFICPGISLHLGHDGFGTVLEQEGSERCEAKLVVLPRTWESERDQQASKGT